METADTRPDTDEEPITFDDAAEEVYNVENADEHAVQEAA